jgi:hypothetical protein
MSGNSGSGFVVIFENRCPFDGRFLAGVEVLDLAVLSTSRQQGWHLDNRSPQSPVVAFTAF